MKLPAIFVSKSTALVRSNRPPPVDRKHAIERLGAAQASDPPALKSRTLEVSPVPPVTQPHIAARCQANRYPFLMIVEAQADKSLLIVDSQIVADQPSISAKRNSGEALTLNFEGELKTSYAYKCPHCTAAGFVKCNNCNHYSCGVYGVTHFECPHCRTVGNVVVQRRFKVDVIGQARQAAGAAGPRSTAPPRPTSTAVTISPSRGVTRPR